jgi:pimeloyl-ACP methyl ester carboxylesterase
MTAWSKPAPVIWLDIFSFTSIHLPVLSRDDSRGARHMPFCDTTAGQLHYTHNGVKTSGPHLILIHGAGGEIRCWPATWRLASSAQSSVGLSITSNASRITNHSVYAIDLPGHGRSTGPALETIDALADVVEQFIETLGLKQTVIVGHSMGGAIALALAARSNPNIAAQVIVASAARIGVTDEILNGLMSDFPKTVDFIVKYSFDRSSSPFFPNKARDYTMATGPTSTHADFLACSTFDMRADLAQMTLPTLVIAAEGDRMIPFKHSAGLAEALPNASLVTIANSGHYPHLERTAAVEGPIAKFCADLE